MPITIELPGLASQTGFNLTRWTEILGDPDLARIPEKRVLYFDAGAAEVCICNRDGSFAFFSAPDHQVPHSVFCPLFPERIS